MTTFAVVRTERYRCEYDFHVFRDGKPVARDFADFDAAKNAARDHGYRVKVHGAMPFVAMDARDAFDVMAAEVAGAVA